MENKMKQLLKEAKEEYEAASNIGKEIYKNIVNLRFGKITATSKGTYYVQERFTDSSDIDRDIKYRCDEDNFAKVVEGFGANNDVELLSIKFWKNSIDEEYFTIYFKEC